MKTSPLEDVLKIAALVAESKLLGTMTKAQAAVVILAGQELGLDPMRAIRSLKPIRGGKLSEDADSQLGRFKEQGGRAQFVQLDDSVAKLKLTHPNGDEHLETFSLDDAKRANLAGSDTWKKYTKAMLRSRAITSGLKGVGWAGGSGLYGTDEADEVDQGGSVVEVAPTTEPVTETNPEPPPAPSPHLTVVDVSEDTHGKRPLYWVEFSDGNRAGTRTKKLANEARELLGQPVAYESNTTPRGTIQLVSVQPDAVVVDG